MYQYDVMIVVLGALAVLAFVAYASRWISGWKRARGYLEYASLGSIYGGLAGFLGLVILANCCSIPASEDETAWPATSIWVGISVLGATIALALKFARRRV